MNEDFKRLISMTGRYFTLQLDYARLSAAEKLTMLLSVIAFYALLVILCMVTLLFVSIGVGHLLATTVAPHLAYFFVGAFYLLIVIALVVFRKQLIFNPAARFISKLLVKNPNETK